MGAYLSKPLTAKHSSDAASARLHTGASCMQGWRVMQEDAHNQILDYDTDSSLFAVYDGHGGAEVAKYCAQKLPQFIKDTEAYKNGDFVQALEDAFLGFDATIADKEIIQLLKTLAGPENSVGDEGSDEEENVHNLCEEARMPLDEVMAKYQNNAPNSLLSNFKSKNETENPLSPNIRSKRASTSSDGASSSSSKCTIDDKEGVSSSTSTCAKKSEDENESRVSTSNGHHSLPESPAEITSTDECAMSKNAVKKTDEIQSSSEVASTESCEITQSEKQDGASKSDANLADDKPEASNSAKSSGSGGSSSSSKSSNAERSESLANMVKKCAPGFYSNLLGMMINNDDDDESDSNDETFESKEYASSSDEENAVNGVNGDSSDDDEVEEEDSSEHTEIDEEEDMDEFSLNIKNEPGSSSGCTAVVALLQNNQLYVANAGDSRCVVCRNGQAIDMSIDHKPEDTIELDRITKAGGNVSSDGRVNGGLNLSRAIGDLGYKQNKELSPQEQMITALPDVKTLTIDPETDSFMVLACDGIWNFMSSQNVVDFISERLAEGREKLSMICEEMFDHCLAPNTHGDGTGCDNMTAVIVKFNPTPKNDSESSAAKKRPSDDGEETEQEAQAKRPKTDNESVDVSSSV